MKEKRYNSNKNVKLYNVLFPFWMLVLFPIMWLIILPGNFIIDSLVLLFSMKFLKVEEKKLFYKKNILKIFAFGMISDIIGAAFLFLMLVTEISTMGDELYFTIPALIISAVMIYIFNYYITFKKQDKVLRHKMALTFAVVTAPYTFLIPTTWLY